MNDNRNYNYQHPSSERIEYSIIMNMIRAKSSIIDLGCGDGSLLENLIKEKNIRGQGIEISKTGIKICQEKGLNVTEGRIDIDLPFSENAFDYAICNVTIQMVMYPEILIKEMRRIAQYQIISFPNFAYFKNRLELLYKGRMPKHMLFGYTWYTTGHIHQLSIKDFKFFCKQCQLRIIQSVPINQPNNKIKKLLINKFPNLFSLESVFLLQKD